MEYKKSSFTFAYRTAPQDLADVVIAEMRAELDALLETTPEIVVKQGVFVIEVRPAGVHKGEIAKELIAQHAADGNIGFAFVAGDEGTDEDMFVALHTTIEGGQVPADHAWSVFVNGVYGLRSCARYMVSGIPDLISVLGELAGVTEA